MYYIGFDIAKENHYASIANSNGEVIQEAFLVKKEYWKEKDFKLNKSPELVKKLWIKNTSFIQLMAVQYVFLR